MCIAATDPCSAALKPVVVRGGRQWSRSSTSLNAPCPVATLFMGRVDPQVEVSGLRTRGPQRIRLRAHQPGSRFQNLSARAGPVEGRSSRTDGDAVAVVGPRPATGPRCRAELLGVRVDVSRTKPSSPGVDHDIDRLRGRAALSVTVQNVHRVGAGPPAVRCVEGLTRGRCSVTEGKRVDGDRPVRIAWDGRGPFEGDREVGSERGEDAHRKEGLVTV